MDALVHRGDHQPSWLPDPALCGDCWLLVAGAVWSLDCCQPTCGWGQVPGWLIEGGLQNGIFQYQCPCDRKTSPKMAAMNIYIPRRSPSCLLLLQDQQVGLTQAPFILLLLPRSPICNPHWPSKPDVLGLICTGVQCRTPRLGSSMWGLDLLLLGENLCNCDYLPVCESPTLGCGS